MKCNINDYVAKKVHELIYVLQKSILSISNESLYQ